MEAINNVVKITHDSGFFSCCIARLLGAINFYNLSGSLPVIDSSEQWKHYKDDNNEDVTNKFFKDCEHINTNLEKIIPVYNTHDKLTDYQCINYCNFNYDHLSIFIDRYFTVSQEVENIYNHLISKYNIDLNNTLAVCYRGNDKRTETNVPEYEEVYNKIKQVVLDSPNIKILIQSDEVEFCNFMIEKYPSCIIIEETKKINKAYTAIQYTIEVGKRVENAQIFLAVMQIMSKCKKVVLNSGNVGMWICLFRKSCKDVYQHLNVRLDIFNEFYLEIKVDENKWVINN